MSKSKEIDAIGTVRRIRDRQARDLLGLTPEEIMAYFREAGSVDQFGGEGTLSRASNKRLQRTSGKARRAGKARQQVRSRRSPSDRTAS